MKNSGIVKIEDIENAKNKNLKYDFCDYIEGIDSKEPLRGELVLSALGDLIKVCGHVNGVAILECDLCLEKYDYGFDIDIEEFYAKNNLHEEYGTETELKEGQFIEDLAGAKEINIFDLLYQSVILNFPNKKICGINCKGNTFVKDENYIPTQEDPRMEIFKSIKIKKSE